MKIKEILTENEFLTIESILSLKYDINLENYDKTDRANKLIDEAETNERLNQIRAALVKANNKIQNLLTNKDILKFRNYPDFGQFQTKAMNIKAKHTQLIKRIDSLLR